MGWGGEDRRLGGVGLTADPTRSASGSSTFPGHFMEVVGWIHGCVWWGGLGRQVPEDFKLTEDIQKADERAEKLKQQKKRKEERLLQGTL